MSNHDTQNHDILKAIREILSSLKKEYGAAQDLSKVYLGISGGVDSMALFFAFYLYNSFYVEKEISEIHLLHFDHKLREDSSWDGKMIRNYVNVLSQQSKRQKAFPPLFYHEGSADVSEYAKKQSLSLEAAARELRYSFFEKTLKEQKASVIYLAHHKQDQIESILLHLFRGSGIQGVLGMSRIAYRADLNFFVVRPFLSMDKQGLYEFCKKNQVPWREDTSNQEMIYTRNYIRNSLLPSLEKNVNWQASENILRFSEILKEEDDYLQTATDQAFREMQEQMHPILRRNADYLRAVALDRSFFLQLPLAIQRRMIRKVIQSFLPGQGSFSLQNITEIRSLFSRETNKIYRHYGMIFLVDFFGLLIFLERDFLKRKENWRKKINASHGVWEEIFLPQEEEEQEGKHSFRFEREWPMLAHRIIITQVKGSECQFSDQEQVFYYDFRRLPRLLLETAEPHFIFERFGGGAKEMRRLFTDQKIPKLLREAWPVLSDGEHIIWAPDMGRTKYYPIAKEKDKNRWFYRIEWRKVC